MADKTEDRIHKMFSGRCLFITGGTGFLGKVLIEKLLRFCPTIKKIYMMVRPKKGKDPKERLLEVFDNPLFDKSKEQRGVSTIFDQCEVICGDCSLPYLGISEEDRKIIADNVTLIYHCAATIRFDADFKEAVLLNTRGTKLMLELAENCPKLELFCHVSTAYCHLNEKMSLEKPYPPPADPHKIIKAIEWLDNDVVNAITDKDYDKNIYHLTSSAEIKVSWDQLITIGRWIVCNRVPLNGVMWYPGGSIKKNRLYHNICGFFYHWVPAYFIDCLLFCLGYPPVLCRVHRRVQKGFEVLEYYANNQWDFDNANVLHLRTIINSVEKEKYPIQDDDIDLFEYFEQCVLAARRYILKESDESLPAARRHMKM